MTNEEPQSGSTQPKPQRPAPKGRPGATLVREEETRTHRGATVAIREWWHRSKGQAPYRFIEARSSSGLLGEYTTAVRGNAAIVFEAFAAGVYDLGTPLGDLPPGLSRAMGRGWLKASDGACARQHITGAAKGCSHRADNLLQPAALPAIYAGPSDAEAASSDNPPQSVDLVLA